ncbi:MAG: MFS transporter [Patescibacteria group bacterium]|nr:MFS transporter [Patescibacteria group bacterium]
MKIKINIDIKVGRIVKYFVLSDLFLLAGWGFIDPIFSVFIVEKVVGATLATVGMVAGIYWILKSILQIPIANALDQRSGEKDDFIALIAGLVLAGISAIAFAWVRQVWQLYFVQAVHAIGFALYVPSWSAIFSRHLDKDRVSFDWSLDSTVSGFSAGFMGLLGGIAAAVLGFPAVFIMAGMLSLAAAVIIMAVPDVALPKPVARTVEEEKTPANLGV